MFIIVCFPKVELIVLYIPARIHVSFNHIVFSLSRLILERHVYMLTPQCVCFPAIAVSTEITSGKCISKVSVSAFFRRYKLVPFELSDQPEADVKSDEWKGF